MNVLTREEQRKAEMSRGAKQIKIDMAEGFINKLLVEMVMKSTGEFTCNLIPTSDNVRIWEVEVKRDDELIHTENFWDFPSDELRAKIMLLRG